jgi:hypothetical protein
MMVMLLIHLQRSIWDEVLCDGRGSSLVLLLLVVLPLCSGRMMGYFPCRAFCPLRLTFMYLYETFTDLILTKTSWCEI